MIDGVLLAIYFAISFVALRLIGFGWWWASALAIVIALLAWSFGRMTAPDA